MSEVVRGQGAKEAGRRLESSSTDGSPSPPRLYIRPYFSNVINRRWNRGHCQDVDGIVKGIDSQT